MGEIREKIYEEVYGSNWKERRARVLHLRQEMARACLSERYEEAAKIRDRIGSLELKYLRF